MTECIIRQSVMNENHPFQSLSNLMLTGLSTADATLNTDDGKLYGSFVNTGTSYELSLYKDITRMDLVATASSVALGLATIVPSNNSGLSGTVNFAQYISDDTLIEVICFLSKDTDIPMNNLESLRDYDAVVGFADVHLRAFTKIKEIVTAKYKALLYNSELIDTRYLNGAKGGYDLSRWNNPQVLKEASAYYALYLLCERQTIEEGSIFEKRSKESRNVFKAHIEATELAFDINQDRKVERERTGCTFKISRA